jgi:UDP-N-acetylmuramoyl-tripeptide--D-alanyl-D-alanine ligase
LNIQQIHQHFLNSSGICTDTRKIEKNCMFFALKGDHFNGNEFAAAALASGARVAVIDDPSFQIDDKSTILCNDSLQTLQALANFHRKYLNIPIISLTGSNGKTTTKELIHAVLARKFNCVATKGNLNNHIGVPLTLLSMNSTTEIGIVEMGANHQGEIGALCEIAEPSYGYITNFGKAHLEGFGGVEGVIKGKSELYQFIQTHKGIVFVNGTDSKQLELTSKINRIVFNGSDPSFQITNLSNEPFLQVGYKNRPIKSQLIGTYNFSNIAAAIAIGDYFDVPIDKIEQAISTYSPQMNRSQVLKLKGHTLILDAYNANPSSMMAAIENFEKMSATSKLLILGDMFELGKDAPHEHQCIVDYMVNNDFGHALFVGKNFFTTSGNASNIQKFETFEDLKHYLVENTIPKSTILIKGSRGMALERTLAIFE